MVDKGKYYEDFVVGETIKNGVGRTLTDNDNIWFTLLTCNTNQIHFNVDYTRKNFSEEPFNGRLLVNGYLVLAIVIGLSVNETSKTGIMLAQKNMNVLAPTFAGDTIYSETRILSKRESKSHQNMGIIEVKTTGVNQNSVKVIELERTFMVRKTGAKWS